MVELLTGAVFTMFLDEANDYYVKPVKDDPPDVEVLAVERDRRAFSTMKLEIVQDGKYSESVFEVISSHDGRNDWPGERCVRKDGTASRATWRTCCAS